MSVINRKMMSRFCNRIISKIGNLHNTGIKDKYKRSFSSENNKNNSDNNNCNKNNSGNNNSDNNNCNNNCKCQPYISEPLYVAIIIYLLMSCTGKNK